MWKAEWIWGSGEPSPRNEWRCFRRVFNPGEHGVKDATLRLTADSRYVLYVNDVLTGRGPVRSWPEEQSYDTYEIGHLLKPGCDNTIAVLVAHYGAANFQYLRGIGGLILQIETPGSNDPLLITDASWKTVVHSGYDSHTSRMSCQLAFTERYDARALSPAWRSARFNDETWEQAMLLDKGNIPWKTLVPRTIPFLTEEPVFPARIDSVRRVKSVDWSASLDLRQLFAPESSDHANNISISGMLATVVELAQPAKLTIGSVDRGRLAFRLSVDGVRVSEGAYRGSRSERYADLSLNAGRHFMLIDITGTTHGHSYHLGIECDVPFRLLHPLDLENDSADQTSAVPLAAIGPFESIEHIDHQTSRTLDNNHPDYVNALRIDGVEALRRASKWLRSFPEAYINTGDVFGASVWLKSCEKLSVPAQFQHAVTSGPDYALIPISQDGCNLQIIVDFGQELSGYLSFELEAAAGTVIDAYGFEYMHNGKIQHTFELDNTLRYICSDGRQSYRSPVRRGLRYVMLTVANAPEPVKLINLQLYESSYPVPQVGHFHSGDTLLNEIWSISRHTAKLCMEDTFVDCPAYEQAYWVGDARNEALVAYYAFGSKELVERCLRLVPGSAGQTPYYADQVPSGWNSVIPNWTFFWVTACLEYYRYSGDQSFAASMWPRIKYTLTHYMSNIDERGLFAFTGWNLLDWAGFEQPEEGVVAPQNMFLAKALQEGAMVAEAAGEPGDAEQLKDWSRKLKKAINVHLWADDRQAYLDCIHADGRASATTSMQTQIVALLCGIPEEERKQQLIRYMEQPPSSFVQIGSPFMSFFYHEALAMIGRYDLLLQDMRKQYGVMVAAGASTCWEMYPTSSSVSGTGWPTRSHCHAWSAGPVYFLGRYVLGVSGVTPGWRNVAVRPQLCGLSSASGSVPLPGGERIDISWQADTATKRFKLVIAAPDTIEIVVEAPDGYTLELEQTVLGEL